MVNPLEMKVYWCLPSSMVAIDATTLIIPTRVSSDVIFTSSHVGHGLKEESQIFNHGSRLRPPHFHILSGCAS